MALRKKILIGLVSGAEAGVDLLVDASRIARLDPDGFGPGGGDGEPSPERAIRVADSEWPA